MRIGSSPTSIDHDATSRSLDVTAARPRTGGRRRGRRPRAADGATSRSRSSTTPRSSATTTTRRARSGGWPLFVLGAAIGIFLLLQAAFASWRLAVGGLPVPGASPSRRRSSPPGSTAGTLTLATVAGAHWPSSPWPCARSSSWSAGSSHSSGTRDAHCRELVAAGRRGALRCRRHHGRRDRAGPAADRGRRFHRRPGDREAHGGRRHRRTDHLHHARSACSSCPPSTCASRPGPSPTTSSVAQLTTPSAAAEPVAGRPWARRPSRGRSRRPRRALRRDDHARNDCTARRLSVACSCWPPLACSLSACGDSKSDERREGRAGQHRGGGGGRDRPHHADRAGGPAPRHPDRHGGRGPERQRRCRCPSTPSSTSRTGRRGSTRARRALVYHREPIEIDRIDGDIAVVLTSGPAAGTPVVTVGRVGAVGLRVRRRQVDGTDRGVTAMEREVVECR